MTDIPPARCEGGWDRAQLTIRLTAARKKKLTLIAAQERLAGGPGDAIDRALDLALSEPPEEVAERIEALEAAVREGEERRARDSALAATELGKVTASLDALRKLLAELAAEEE